MALVVETFTFECENPRESVEQVGRMLRGWVRAWEGSGRDVAIEALSTTTTKRRTYGRIEGTTFMCGLTVVARIEPDPLDLGSESPSAVPESGAEGA